MYLGHDFTGSAKIIDTHCHLDDERYNDDLAVLLENSFANNIDKIIIPAASPKDLPRAIALCEAYERLFFAVGVHPNEAENFDEKPLREFIAHKKCVAVGECGLDYYRLKADDLGAKAEQRRVFLAQIALAREFKKPLIIHTREANFDTHELIKSHAAGLCGVFHCFNASELLLEFSENFYYGIGGVLTFKNAKNLVEILPKIPQNRLLIETDAPYLTPEPFRGQRNEPFFTHFVASKMAEILQIPRNEIIEICSTNSKNLFFKDKNV